MIYPAGSPGKVNHHSGNGLNSSLLVAGGGAPCTRDLDEGPPARGVAKRVLELGQAAGESRDNLQDSAAPTANFNTTRNLSELNHQIIS